MPKWPQEPTWTPIANINQGNQYVAADGVTALDMNRIIGNMLYLKTHGSQINVSAAEAHVSNNTLFLKLKET